MDPVTAGLRLGSQLIDRFFPDKAAADAARLELLAMHQRGDLAALAERAGIVRAEAQSDHWLAACWRPVVMLTFTGLIVARWLGWSSPQLSDAEVLQLWDIVELGLGGYVMGRTIEKVTPTLADAIKARRGGPA